MCRSLSCAVILCPAGYCAAMHARDGMSSASFYKWRAKIGGMDASMISELKAMAEENRRLKRMYTEMSMQNDLLGSSWKKR